MGSDASYLYPQLCSHLLPTAGRGAEGVRRDEHGRGCGEWGTWAPLLSSPLSPPFPARGGALPTPGNARSRSALGPWRSARRRYKRPRSHPTRNPRLRPVPGVPTCVGPEAGPAAAQPTPAQGLGGTSAPGPPPRAPWALPTPRPRRCGSSRARQAVSIPRGTVTGTTTAGRLARGLPAHGHPLGFGPPRCVTLD